MLRLFVALDLPESLRTRLAGLQHDLPGARWVAPENIHLTLRFIGETPPESADALSDALGGVQDWEPFPLALQGVGQFPKQGMPRVLWVGVEESAGLTDLAQAVESAVQSCGLPRADKPFAPHITLARFKAKPDQGKLHRFYARAGDFSAAPFTVRQFTLYASQLTPQGPRYTPQQVVAAQNDA